MFQTTVCVKKLIVIDDNWNLIQCMENLYNLERHGEIGKRKVSQHLLIPGA